MSNPMPSSNPSLSQAKLLGVTYAEQHRRSVTELDAFWLEKAALIDWQVQPGGGQPICDFSNPPFTRWFAGGTTNLCHNAVDRHLATRAQQAALIYVSSETGTERTYTYAQLHTEVQQVAAVLRELGVGQGDRVLVYMPMVAEAVFVMLACARLGAIHSVVFGGFASVSLASRIEGATPKVIVSSDAGSRAGKVIAYKPLLDAAIELSTHKPQSVLLFDRGLSAMQIVAERDHGYWTMAEKHANTVVPCTWVDATHPSYTLYTSGTTGKPKGVQRDTGGYAVTLATSMKDIFQCEPGETTFCTSDIGWVVGHSYIVYGPLLGGCTTLMYEGLPIRGMDGGSDPGIWWRLVEKYKVRSMFSSPTAVRVLKKHDPAHLSKYDLSSLKALYLAGEPLDEPTAQWISQGIGKPIIDNYWQTESGSPILAIANGIEAKPSKFGSPGLPMLGYVVKVVSESTGDELAAGEKGVVVIEGPTPPGFMQTVWQDDDRFVKTYWQGVEGKQVYSTFDWGIKDKDGYFFILGRTDDVINVAGHRLGTREIEEAILAHPAVAEVAVVGVADALKGQVAMAFAVLKNPAAAPDDAAKLALEGDILKGVDTTLGAVARPSRVRFVSMLPKTRSGKMLRRAIQAVCEGKDPGDLTTLEDPAALQQVRDLF